MTGKQITLSLGEPIVIARGVKHSFYTNSGCVIEEISTTHYKGDSVYQNPEINKLSVDDRKIEITIQ